MRPSARPGGNDDGKSLPAANRYGKPVRHMTMRRRGLWLTDIHRKNRGGGDSILPLDAGNLWHGGSGTLPVNLRQGWRHNSLLRHGAIEQRGEVRRLAGTAGCDAATPCEAEEKSSAFRLESMFISYISCPLHPAVARQGRQLVLPPFLQVRVGAILELFGDFAIAIGHLAETFLHFYLTARIVERTIQLTAGLLQPTSKFLHRSKIRANCHAGVGKKIAPHLAQPVGVAFDAVRLVLSAGGFSNGHGMLHMADAQHALAGLERTLHAPNSAISAPALVSRSMRLF